MDRRRFLQASGALSSVALSGCHRFIKPGAPAAPAAPAIPALPFYDKVDSIPPIRADVDRIYRITVCLRPFRAAGPRFDLERVGDKAVIHNYGHGGSGWSLSWGSAELVVNKALVASNGNRNLAVIGCGALGLTAAITAQRAGFAVTIYAKERPPFVRSSRATGSWTPDSRIALTADAGSAFPAQWESMARTSFAMYQSYLGLPGYPVEWTDRYLLGDQAPGSPPPPPGNPPVHDFIHLQDRLADITPAYQQLPPGASPFRTTSVARTSSMTFNIGEYSRQLLNDFLLAGGKIETREFNTPNDLTSLPEPVLIDCTGYAARKLWSDETVVPIRGQIAWLIPQEGVHYGIYYRDLNVLARRDGIVIQPNPGGDDFGWNDDNETPDRAAAEDGVRQLQAIYANMQPPPPCRPGWCVTIPS
jgi:glycine/D-amino acid oxidase-like deaminating enzyme